MQDVKFKLNVFHKGSSDVYEPEYITAETEEDFIEECRRVYRDIEEFVQEREV